MRHTTLRMVIFCLVFQTGLTWSQTEVRICGTVSSSDGLPLANAQVSFAKASGATVTDAQGAFSLTPTLSALGAAQVRPAPVQARIFNRYPHQSTLRPRSTGSHWSISGCCATIPWKSISSILIR